MRATGKRILTLLIAFAVIVSTLAHVPAKIAKAANDVSVNYRTHIQTFGWEGEAGKTSTWKKDGDMSGTSGKSKRLEGIEIIVEGDANLGIQYTTHCQTYGWLPWSSNGEMNGTEGEAKRLEAIKIQLTGADASKYDVYYRVHAQTYGWLSWAKNGQAAGTAGLAKRLEGIQVVVVSKGETLPNEYKGIKATNDKAYISKTGALDENVSGANKTNVIYKTHVQTFGWQGWKNNGKVSGTSGLAKRLEGINIKLTNKQYNGGITYRTHVQTYGWQGWVSDGAMSGTSGQAKRLESIQIYLTGEIAKYYDVYYRVHAQSYGWLGWVKNGEPSGTAGYGKRLEAIQIVLVDKNSGAPGDVEGVRSRTTTGFVYKSADQIPVNPFVEQNTGTTGDTSDADYIDVTDYSYEIIPLNAPFNNMYFVKTDNPNPNYVRFIDKESKYYDEARASNVDAMSMLKPVGRRFIDVQYEDKETGRVNGGYFFELENYGTDGGDFVLQQADRAFHIEYRVDGGYTYNNPVYTDTSVTVKCEPVMPVDYYLVEYHTDPTKDLFTNLNSAQSALRKLAVYPKWLQDTSKPNEDRPYPLLATSPYPELGLNDHYSMYENTIERSLLFYSYPVTADSLSFPNAMASVATILEPDCTIKANGSMHWMIDVTYDGRTEMYGGAGEGSSDPVYTRCIGTLYTYDGSANDYSTKSVEERRAKILEIGTKSEEELAVYRDMITGDTFKDTIKNEEKGTTGAWLKVAAEGGFGYGLAYTYVYTQTYNDYVYLRYASEVWVDGRYVNVYNCIEPDATFEEYPEATIIVRDMTYVNEDGETVTQDVAFEYISEYDAWYGHNAYFERGYYSSSDWEKIPDYMILTHEEVGNMDVDKNTSEYPKSGLVYDGTVEPGTPFSN